MLVNLPYDDLFVPRMGSVTFAGRFCGTRWGGGGWGVLLLNGRLRPKGELHARGRLILVVKFIMAFPFVEGYTGYTKVESIKKQEYGFIDLDRAIHIPMVDNRCCYAHNILCLFLGYRVPKCDVIENEICEIMGFVKIF